MSRLNTTPAITALLAACMLIGGCATSRSPAGGESPRQAPQPAPDTPAVLVRITPEYPEDADGVEGHVTLTFSLNDNGNPIDIRVVESEPPGVFDDAAVRALRYWLFRPDPDFTDRRFRQTFEFSQG